jgi:four helix bundle protein
MTYKRFEDLPVWKAALKLGVGTYALTRQGTFRIHGSLRDQIERAAVSVSSNIAEGFERGTTQELITFLYYAKGSTGEVRSMLRLMEALPDFSGTQVALSDLRSLAENVARQLRGFADSLQNSEIRGVRYLTEQARRTAENGRRAAEFDEHLRRIVERSRGRTSFPDGGPALDDEEHKS